MIMIMINKKTATGIEIMIEIEIMTEIGTEIDQKIMIIVVVIMTVIIIGTLMIIDHTVEKEGIIIMPEILVLLLKKDLVQH